MPHGAAGTSSPTSASGPVTHVAWHLECDRIAHLARRTARDARADAALAALTGVPTAAVWVGGGGASREAGGSGTTLASTSPAAAAAPAPSFMQRMLYSTPSPATSNTPSPVVALPAALPQSSTAGTGAGRRSDPAIAAGAALLALMSMAELPPPATLQSAASDAGIELATGTATHAALAAARADVWHCLVHASAAEGGGAGATASAPTGTAASAARTQPSLITASHAIFPTRETPAPLSSSSAGAALPVHVIAEGWPLGTASGRAAGGAVGRDSESDFDAVFARLKQQAVERSRTGAPPPPRGSAARQSGSTATAAAAAAATGPTASPAPAAGLAAAREALEAVDALLLRLRREVRLSTSAYGRLAEAQTLLLRATVLREAQLYTDAVLRAVTEQTSAGDGGAPGRRGASWVPLLTAAIPAPLIAALRACVAPSRQASPHSSPSTALSPTAFPAGAVRTGTSAISANNNCSSSGSGLQRPFPSLSSATTNTAPGRFPASAKLADAIARWRRLVASQQRSLRLGEVQDYLDAARLFLAAAVEEQRLGGGGGGGGRGGTAAASSEGRNGLPSLAADTESSLMLATRGVTHTLQACELLLSDIAMAQEVPYPASFVSEMAALLGDGARDVSDEPVPPLGPIMPSLHPRGCPHTARVWMLLVQLATFLERTGLQLSTDAASRPPPDGNAMPGRRVSGVVQSVWELAAAVLLCTPADALQALSAPVAVDQLGASGARGGTPQIPLLRQLFRGVAGVAAAPRGGGLATVVQPGTLPLCLLALRRAVAAAVREGHDGEALLDVEVGLHVLQQHQQTLAAHEFPETTSTAPATGDKTDRSSAATAMAGGADAVALHRIAHWPPCDGPAPRTTMSTARTVSVAVTHLADGIVLAVTRVLLLLVSSPLASGEAAARLLKVRQQQTDAAGGAEHAWWRGAHFGQARAAAEASPSASSSLGAAERRSPTCLPDQPLINPLDGASDLVRGAAVALASALDRVADVADQLHLLERHVRLVDSRTTVHAAASGATRTGMAASACASHDRLLPSLPTPAHRLGRVLAAAKRTAAATSSRATGAEAEAPQESTEATARPRASTPATVDPVSTHAAPSCRRSALTSSAAYAALKHRHRTAPSTEQRNARPERIGPEDAVHDAAQAAAAAASDGATTTISDAVDDGDVATPQSAVVNAALPVRQSASALELLDCLQGLWRLASTLTLPLRVASTSATPPTAASDAALSAALAAGEPWFADAVPAPGLAAAAPSATPQSPPQASSSPPSPIKRSDAAGLGGATTYGAARVALHGVEPRLERCLHVLGARDRTVLVLLRRLETALLFPAACAPLVQP